MTETTKVPSIGSTWHHRLRPDWKASVVAVLTDKGPEPWVRFQFADIAHDNQCPLSQFHAGFSAAVAPSPTAVEHDLERRLRIAESEVAKWKEWDDRMVRALNRRGIRAKHHTIDTIAACADDARMLADVLADLDTWARRARADGRVGDAELVEGFRKHHTPFYPAATVGGGQATISQSDADLIRLSMAQDKDAPVPMVLHCPDCSARHIDHGDFATKPHHTHSCQACGLTWRPAVVATVGVQYLPGFKDTSGPNADLSPPQSPGPGTQAQLAWLTNRNKTLQASLAKAEENANALAMHVADIVAERDDALRNLGTPPQLDTAGNVVPGSPDLSKVPNADVPKALDQLHQLAKDIYLGRVAPAAVPVALRSVIRTLGGSTP